MHERAVLVEREVWPRAGIWRKLIDPGDGDAGDCEHKVLLPKKGLPLRRKLPDGTPYSSSGPGPLQAEKACVRAERGQLRGSDAPRAMQSCARKACWRGIPST